MPQRKPKPVLPPLEQARFTSLRFDTGTHPEAVARSEAFRAALSVSMDIHYEPEDVEAFAGGFDLHAVGSATLAVLFSTPHTSTRTKTMADRWTYDVVALDLFTKGGFSGQLGGRSVTVGPGDLVMIDLRGSMRIRLTTHRCISLVMPRAAFDAAAGGYLAVDGLKFPADSAEARLLTPLLVGLLDAVPALDTDRVAALGAGAVAFAAACARARLPLSRGPRAKPAMPTIAHLRRHIDRHAADPQFGPDALASHFHLSRATLYRLFTPVDGVAAVIRRARTELVLQKLRHDRDVSLAAVARASGFADVRTMRDALRTLHGLTPGEARASASNELRGEAEVGTAIAAFLDSTDP